jgi:CubicO group peptidase (beta-lactamase class C family)
VDAFLEGEIQRQRIPGLAVAVLKDGAIVKARAFGLANVELEVPASTESVFEIASITKTFTAAAVMLLVESGKLSLDDALSRFFEDSPSQWKAVKVQHLLAHTGGLERDAFPLTTNAARMDYAPVEIEEKARRLPLLFEPGSAFSYSNLGYILLGRIIEKVSGQSYGEFLANRVWKPLGMLSTRMNDRHEVLPRRVAGYEWDGSLHVADPQSPTYYAPAGGIVSTVLDMAKWEQLFEPGRLLRRESLEKMLEPTGLANGSTTGYGLGWNINFHRGHKCYDHSGGIRGFRSAFLHYPQYRLTVVVLCNLLPAEPERIARAVAGLYASGVVPLGSIQEPEDPEPALTRDLFGALVDLGGGKPSSLVTPELHADLERWPERRQKVARDLRDLRCFAYVANDRDLDPSLYRPGGRPLRMWHCHLLTGNEERFYSFSLTGEGKVCWIDIQNDG